MIMAYATYTGTRRNMAALREAEWGILLNPYLQRDPKGMRYMLDNGAWTMFQIEQAQLEGRLPTAAPDVRFPEELTLEEAFDIQFTRLCDRFGAGADYIVVPDIVASPYSLDRSLEWLDALAFYGAPLIVPVQNGMTVDQIRPIVGLRTFEGRRWRKTVPVGIFVGGDTDWKLATMGQWAALAQSEGVPCHVGRVNTQQRVRMCLDAGVTSFDGTSASRYEVTLRDLDMARRGHHWVTSGNHKDQLTLFGMKMGSNDSSSSNAGEHRTIARGSKWLISRSMHG